MSAGADGPAAAVAAAIAGAWRASGFDTEARPPGPGYWLRRNTGKKEHPPGPRDPRPDSACRLGAFAEVVRAFAGLGPDSESESLSQAGLRRTRTRHRRAWACQ